jgi:uncharacterized RDD family membrane protein YckC
MKKHETLVIRTPEGISFSFRLAGPLSRFLAWTIDLAAVLALSFLLSLLFRIVGMISRDLATAASILVFFVIPVGYGIALEWHWRGQTIGKRLFRLRVMDAQGLRLQFNQVVIRNLLRFVDNLPAFYMVGGLACLVSSHAQRLGDLAANTIVAWNPKISRPDLDQLMRDKFNSFRRYPHLEARLRQHVSPQEAHIALQALIRRNEFAPEARVQLFGEIAAHFKSIVEFPEEATVGLSPEQYVRNIVDSLFRSHTGIPAS